MAPQIPGFFKIVFQRNIDSSSLKLLTKFTREYSGELFDAVHLVVSDGRIWKVELTREGEQLSLSNGFDEFARHYSLCHGHLLVFKFKGMSCFGVTIYDHNNCQIAYPSHNPTTGKAVSKIVDCEYMSKCGIPTPRHFRSKRPHFEVMLQKYNFNLNFVFVPAKTAKLKGKAQLEKPFTWLETDDKSMWRVSLRDATKGRFRLGRMADFFVANKLKENDICIFEVVEEHLMEVFIFSAI